MFRSRRRSEGLDFFRSKSEEIKAGNTKARNAANKDAAAAIFLSEGGREREYGIL